MPIFHQKTQRQKPSFRWGTQGGFSLVELVVAVAILVTLSATFLFNYGNFDRRITIDILAHQIATWVHDAQVSAMSIRRAATDQTRFPGYGLHFDLATSNRFIYFADLNGNRIYNSSAECGIASVECEQVITLLQGNIVSKLCGDQPSFGGQGADCISVTPGNPSLYPTNVLDIVFVRPDPFTASVWGDANTPYSHAEITVSSPKGYTHTITVWTTGQVSVR